MKRVLLSLVFSLAAALPSVAQPDPNSEPVPLYENFGTVSPADGPSPQIDALAFANYGNFTVLSQSDIPYDFQHVLNYTNTGSMIGFPGFNFDNAFRDQPRQPALNFINARTGTISGSTYLQISASNIVNQGSLSVSPDGWIQIRGQNVDLSRSRLQIDPFGADPGFCIPVGALAGSPTNFTPDVGIIDINWETHTNGLNVSAIISQNRDGTFFVAAPSMGALPSADAFVFTNSTSPTNIFVQAVFVQTRDPDVSTRVKFGPPRFNNDPLLTVYVEMSANESNLVTGQLVKKSLYLVDELASRCVIGAETNLTLLINQSAGTFKPSPYILSRTKPCEFDLGSFSNYDPTNNFFGKDAFYGNTYSNATIVTNIGAAYWAEVDTTAFPLPPIPGATITNTAGRLEIEAENLNMDHMRMRSENFVSIKANNLISSSNAAISVQVLNYDLSSRIGKLLVKDLAVPTVQRFSGIVRMWSGYWTNETGFVGTNAMMPTIPDPTDPGGTNMIPNLETNVVDIVFHALFVDDRLTVVRNGSINDLTLRSTNVTFGDNMRVTGNLRILSDSFTMQEGGALDLTAGISTNWDRVSVPNLNSFTNLGTISMANLGLFGADRTNAYARVLNKGSLSAFSQSFFADEFENDGLISANGRITVRTTTGKLDGGRFAAGEDVRITAASLKLRNASTSGNGLYLTVTDALADSGSDANNTLDCKNGFRLLTKPLVGDLFGTTIKSTVPGGAIVQHIWSAEDRGATTSGYTNNEVIGKLLLNGAAESLFQFSGIGPSNALYVDFLQFQGAITNDVEPALAIDDNLVIYFADSNLPAEDLNGKANGHLRWVQDFAGPNSSVDVVLSNGLTVKMNRSLRNSMVIDSDGDGIANFFDPSPLGGLNLGLAVSQTPTPTALLSWNGRTGAVYQVELSANLSAPDWKYLMTYTNTAKKNGLITIPDPLPPGQHQRFYRLKLVPSPN